MNEIRSGYFLSNPLHRDTRTSLVILGSLLAAAFGVLVLQSVTYASSVAQIWETGQILWGEPLSMLMQILVIWGVVLGIVCAVEFVTQPAMKYGSEFWGAMMTGLPLGFILPFLRVLGFGLVIYIPLGLLSPMVPELFPFATLQFAWMAAAYMVFLWLVVGMVPLLGGIFLMRKWYYKFMAVALFFLLLLDTLQCLLAALPALVNNSIWVTSDTAFVLALGGSLLMSILVTVWSLRGQTVLTIVYAMTGIYIASIATGNFSERLFQWGEMPSAILALLAPLVYVQVVKWILRRDGTAVACLAAGYLGLLAGLLIDNLLQLRVTGQSWLSVLYGVIVLLGAGLVLGYFLGRRITKLLAGRFHLELALLRYMDIGQVAGLMAGMLIGGILAR
jgi:hypothetical protein